MITLATRVLERMRSWTTPKTHILCAVSGGPDSVALAHLLKGAYTNLVIGHVDHHLRKKSGQDATFVRKLAEKWTVPFHTATISVPAHASKRGRGVEEAARDLRYRALERLALKSGCDVIVTAHHADDQAETILMNFLRGTGPVGLAGIPPTRTLRSGIRILRPLLNVSQAELMDYLKTHRLAYRIDPSNRSSRFTRNRIRHSLLPLLEKDYPGLKRRLTALGEIIREEEALWASQINPELRKTTRQNSKTITVDLTRLLGYHKALGRRILRQLLTGISFQDTERIFHLALSPKEHLPVQLSGGLQVERKGKKLIIPRDLYE